jgi:hypothetical protein
MKRSGRLIAVTSVMAALLSSACREAPSDEHVIDEPATVEHLEGMDVARVTLTAEAAERLDIQTAPVEEVGNRFIVPSAAVLVDPNGDFWVYTSPEPLVFLRQQIRIEHEDGDQAFLSKGPPAGTDVVIVGVAELYGAEFEIGH